jgi:ribosomal protein L24
MPPSIPLFGLGFTCFLARLTPSTRRADRVGVKFVEDNSKKVRYFKSNGELVDL